MPLWRMYSASRAEVKPNDKYVPPLEPLDVSTRCLPEWHSTLELQCERNEVMLFTGAPSGQAGAPDLISIIRHQGFDERVAALGGMFGAAVYFAERCSKADAYAGKSNHGNTGALAWRIQVYNVYRLIRVSLG